MEFIDSHSHIYSKRFKADINDVINRSIDSGVTRIYMPNIDHTSIDDMLELELRFPEVCIPMMGLHPCSVNKDFQKELYLVEEWLQKRSFVAVGEMGTDLYWDKYFWEEQQEVFKIQSEWAMQNNIPIVIHCRETIDETINLVKEIKTDSYRGIFHCFTGNVDQATEIEKLGFWMGIGGVSTFKNGGLDEVIPSINIKSIVLETDSPYLAPAPHRGKRNESSYIPIIAKRVSELKGMELEEVARETTVNCLSIFKIHKETQ